MLGTCDLCEEQPAVESVAGGDVEVGLCAECHVAFEEAALAVAYERLAEEWVRDVLWSACSRRRAFAWRMLDRLPQDLVLAAESVKA